MCTQAYGLGWYMAAPLALKSKSLAGDYDFLLVMAAMWMAWRMRG
jgi:hypothetical protein